jgi:tetratricopeptide (TPR) repeat protein
MAAGAPSRRWRGGNERAERIELIRRARAELKALSSTMESVEEIFDDANGDLAVGELESAVEKYRRCIKLDPQFFDGWHALGMALMKLGRFAEAIEAGKKTVELKPNDQIGWTSLSLFYNRNGDIKEAEAAGTKAKILSWGGKIAKE